MRYERKSDRKKFVKVSLWIQTLMNSLLRQIIVKVAAATEVDTSTKIFIGHNCLKIRSHMRFWSRIAKSDV